MAEKKYFYIRSDAEDLIRDLFRKLIEKGNFANARSARKMLDEAIESQAIRLSDMLESKGSELKPKDLQTLMRSDFIEADGL
jgi:hypothetical protein